MSLLPLSSVLAAKPNITVYEYPVVGEWIAECDGFSILADSDYKLTIKEYFDKDGMLIEERNHLAILNGVVYNSTNSTKSLPEGPDRIYFRIDPDTGHMTQTGIALRVHVPGQGYIIINAGRVILDEFWNVLWERGNNMWLNGEIDVLCAALE